VRAFLEENGTLMTATELAAALNSAGLLRANGNWWDGRSVTQHVANAGIENRRKHYRKLGWLTAGELGHRPCVSKETIYERADDGAYDGLWVWATDRYRLFSPECLDVEVPIDS